MKALFLPQVLSVLWDQEPEEVEDILQEFVNKSLLFVDSNHKPHLYYLHDLQLDFLVEQNRAQLEVCFNAVPSSRSSKCLNCCQWAS